MFFILRSAACIGVVFCMLPDSGGSAALHDVAADSGRLAVGTAARYCVADPVCARSGTALATAVLARGLNPVVLPASAATATSPSKSRSIGVTRAKPAPAD